MSERRVFVTGGHGFLGRTLVGVLRGEGFSVDAPTSKECDLTHEAALDAWDAPYELIFHLAAWTQAGDFCLRHPGEQWLINQRINTNVLSWWHRRQRAAAAVLAGTSCSYDPRLPLREDNYLAGEPIDSLYTYAMTKRMLWVGAQSLARQYGMRALNVVPSTLCGPYYHSDGRQMHFVFDLARKILETKRTGEPAVLWGDGLQRREVVAVDDFSRGLLALVAGGRAWGETVNLGAGEDHAIRTFAEVLCAQVGVEPALVHYDHSRYVGARAKCLDVTRARALIEWHPKPLDACMRLVLAAFQDD